MAGPRASWSPRPAASSESEPRMEPLSRQLEARADQLARASVAWMYEDPFWAARYGAERARRFGGEDAQFHVRYLVQAVTEQRASVMEGYATWLRTLLAARGM